MTALPEGDPAPDDGLLPASAAAGAAARTLSLYVHVPFCRTRCGYCDFTTYTSAELGGGADQNQYAQVAAAEIRWAHTVLQRSGIPERPVSTVFFGGGTPTLLPVSDLNLLVATINETFALTPDVELTTEANPDSVSEPYLAELAEGGFTRVSVGMQSAVPHVLATLERTHDPDRVSQVVSWARDAGMSTSLDLIYGTPGESAADWCHTLDLAVAAGPDHVSAYALVVEPGTRMAAQVRRGLLPLPDDDDLADKYRAADAALSAAGYQWYEVSNWARRPDQRCRHNEAYWRGGDWWGVGPGAHSHVGGVRWWNVRHPRPYAQRVLANCSPAAGRETLDVQAQYLERVLLGLRLSSGMTIADLTPAGGAADAVAHTVRSMVARGLLQEVHHRWTLTLHGRLLADAIIRELVAGADR